ncbi:MAG: hypothetical protein IPK19_10780 [Chloroflexi bacterium]|nr:hypothetical protein [Chloroflexota bacterium]
MARPICCDQYYATVPDVVLVYAKAAINKLKAFMDEVEAQRDKKFASAHADVMIACGAIAP